MPSGTLMPMPNIQYFDNNGVPLAGGKLYTYLAGTTTPTPVYTDSQLLVPHPNPVILDAAGRAGAVFLAALSYKFILKTSTDVTIWTVDNVQATNVGQDIIGEVFSFGGDSTSPFAQTSYPVGVTVDKTHAGTSLLRLDSTNLPAGVYVLEGMLLSSAGGLLTLALVNLTDGTPETPLVEINTTSTTGALVTSGPITFALPGAPKDYAIKVKIASGDGFAWTVKLRRVS